MIRPLWSAFVIGALSLSCQASTQCGTYRATGLLHCQRGECELTVYSHSRSELHVALETTDSTLAAFSGRVIRTPIQVIRLGNPLVAKIDRHAVVLSIASHTHEDWLLLRSKPCEPKR